MGSGPGTSLVRFSLALLKTELVVTDSSAPRLEPDDDVWGDLYLTDYSSGTSDVRIMSRAKAESVESCNKLRNRLVTRFGEADKPQFASGDAIEQPSIAKSKNLPDKFIRDELLSAFERCQIQGVSPTRNKIASEITWRTDDNPYSRTTIRKWVRAMLNDPDCRAEIKKRGLSDFFK